MLNFRLDERIRKIEEQSEAAEINPDEMGILLDDGYAEYQHLMNTRQHDAAIGLMERLRRIAPSDQKFDRLTALAYGAKGELVMNWNDQLRLKPGPDLLAEMELVFRRAVAVDPTLADPYWDIAVLKARFAEDFDEARQFYEKARDLDYYHPMMPALEQILHTRQAPPALKHASEEETHLRELLLKLAIHPNIPLGRTFDPRQTPDDASLVLDSAFQSYCRAAEEIVRSGQVSPGAYEGILDDALNIGGDAGEYLLDLLRRVSFEYPGCDTLQKRATEEHLNLLVNASLSLRSQSRSNNDGAMRRARRTASRGLDIIKSTNQFAVDPDLHAEMLMAMGQTYARVESPGDLHLVETLGYYLQALDLKEEAVNAEDVKRLKDLLRQIIEFLMPMAQLSGAVGLGTTLRGLELGYEAAQRLDDPALTCNVAVTLSNVYSAVRQSQQAEVLLEKQLAAGGHGAREADRLKFALASALSEQSRGLEAADIQLSLINANSALLDTPQGKATAYMNYGNSVRVADDLDGAFRAFETAMESATQVPKAAEGQQLQSKLHALMGEILFLKGDVEQGDQAIKTAEATFTADIAGTGRIFFHSTAGRNYFKAGMHTDALRHLNAAREALRVQLEHGAWPSVWESMLNEWSDMDAMVIQILLARQTDDDTRSALVVAEAAKGRLLTWLSQGYLDDAPKFALAPDRHERALDKVGHWTAEKSGRYVASLFANKGGLGIFVLSPDDSISGTWLAEMDYDVLMTDFYEPWEQLIDRSLSVDSGLWDAAGALTELILDRVGEWLWRACPQLAQGGQELVLIPHRLFRSLPLTHCRLPGGKRLSQVFDQVTVASSLYDLSKSISKPPGALKEASGWTALVDPDGSLPFAWFEGLLNVGTAATKTGQHVTVGAIHQALAGSDVALISCHGNFAEGNPWQSGLAVADGEFKVYELLNPPYRIVTDLVVLGACEAARTRRSLSDEPIGFPGMLVQTGVRAVLAPLWKVDDFATLLFLTHFFDTVKAGIHPASAAQQTALWLKRLEASAALELADEMIEQAKTKAGGKDGAIPEPITKRLTAIRHWLQNLGKDTRPYRSPLDWAAFQLVGLPITDSNQP